MTKIGWCIHLVAFLMVFASLAPVGSRLDGMRRIWSQRAPLLGAVELIARQDPWPVTSVTFEPADDGGHYVVETQSPYGLTRHIVDASTGKLVESGSEPLRALSFFLTSIDPEKLTVPFAAAIRTAEDQSGGKVVTGHATVAQDRIVYRIGVSNADGTITALDIDASGKPPTIDRVNGSPQ